MDDVQASTPQPKKPTPKPGPSQTTKNQLSEDDINNIMKSEMFLQRIQRCCARAVATVIAESIQPLKNQVKTIDESVVKLDET